MLIKNQSMESITNFCVSLIKGFIDSLRGVTVLLYLDKEINERALSRSPQPDVDVSRHKLLKQPKVKQVQSTYKGITIMCSQRFYIFT
ncbi:unnamed protein product [Leptidea sinapis]|uniref:Uncharacterized protein n=1 Tax=Leptidea sinapis TaxID=189913 RepID=A0A5E4Q2B4_9NEOP|nr:unnamed protein product [Leptidea sinapis]